MLLAIALPGCYETHVTYNGWDALRKLANGGGHTMVRGGTISGPRVTEHHQNTWAVQIKTFVGRDRSRQAAKLIHSLQQHGQFDHVWLQDDSGLMHVLVGRFQSPQAGQAIHDLRKVRSLTAGGNPLYPNAQLIALTTRGKVHDDPFNLKAYHNEYTLQIGFYDGPNRDKNARQAAKSLRDRGVQAYFYQGPNRSLVTIGMFTRQQAFVTRRDPYSPSGSVTYVQAYSKAVVDLQKRFPYNLDDGRTIKQTVRGKNAGTQQSCLVKTP